MFIAKSDGGGKRRSKLGALSLRRRSETGTGFLDDHLNPFQMTDLICQFPHALADLEAPTIHQELCELSHIFHIKGIVRSEVWLFANTVTGVTPAVSAPKN